MHGVSRVCGFSCVFLLTFVALALSAAEARAATPAPDELTKAWGLKVDATVVRLLDGSVLRKLRSARATLIVDPGLSGATLQRVTQLAKSNKLTLLQPAAGVGECASLAPGTRCAVGAGSPAAATALAGTGEADVSLCRLRMSPR